MAHEREQKLGNLPCGRSNVVPHCLQIQVLSALDASVLQATEQYFLTVLANGTSKVPLHCGHSRVWAVIFVFLQTTEQNT